MVLGSPARVVEVHTYLAEGGGRDPLGVLAVELLLLDLLHGDLLPGHPVRAEVYRAIHPFKNQAREENAQT